MTIKVPCHIPCDGIIMCIFVCKYYPEYRCVKYFSVGMCLCVHMHKLKSRLEILGVSVEVARD